MKNILLLTPIYPASDLPTNTPVVHYFTKEWVKMGYKVVVINYAVNFPSIIHWAAKPIHKLLESKYGSVVRLQQTTIADYELDGVNVKRIPLKKYAPHTRYSSNEINNATILTIEYCKSIQFSPDVIISHWINPQLDIMDRLKRHYKVPTCYIAHDTGRDLKTIYKKEARTFLNNIDLIGYRCDYIKEEFESYFNYYDKTSFLCYSGIPEKFIETLNSHKRNSNLCNRIIYVGTLISRKYPSKIIPACINSFKNQNFSITYIGEGNEDKTIKELASKYKIENQVKLLGRIKREDVIKQLQQNDIFIMISQNETFGLVYLEAMAAGCITIASKNEGFDGIIKDGFNGFLCKAGDEIELAHILEKINKLSPKKREEISRNAVETAKHLTDTNVARTYIKAVEEIVNNVDRHK